MKVFDAAIEEGINLVNTAEFYGIGTSEELLGKAIQKYGRDRFFITSKFGVLRNEKGEISGHDSSPSRIRPCLEASLKRLGIDYIDAYYPSRVDQHFPIEDTIKELVALKNEGKIRFLGLSEANGETIKRALRVAPIHILEAELSLWSLHLRDEGTLDVLRENGISLLAYSPLGRGFLTGEVKKPEDLPAPLVAAFPRFQPQNFAQNLKLVEEVEKLAKQKGITTSQFALAWVLAQGDYIFPIPGSKRAERVRENAKATHVKLTKEDLAAIDAILASFPVQGTRYNEWGMKLANK